MSRLAIEVRRDVAELANTIPRITLTAWNAISNNLLAAADRIEAMEAALRTIPPNYSEHMKSCICVWCENTAKLLGSVSEPPVAQSKSQQKRFEAQGAAHVPFTAETACEHGAEHE